MKIKTVVLTVVTVAFFAFPAFPQQKPPALTFDTKTMMLEGTVEKFEFIRPKILVHLAVPDKKGGVEHWLVETEPPALALRDGWTSDMMKPGDHVVWEVAPAKGVPLHARGGVVVTVNGVKKGQEIQPETVTVPATTR